MAGLPRWIGWLLGTIVVLLRVASFTGCSVSIVAIIVVHGLPMSTSALPVHGVGPGAAVVPSLSIACIGGVLLVGLWGVGLSCVCAFRDTASMTMGAGLAVH